MDLKSILVMIVITTGSLLNSGCSISTDPYHNSVVRVNNASRMNSGVVSGGVATLECPDGYVETDRDTSIGKRVWAEYEEEIGSGRNRSRLGFPSQKFEAGDVTRGKVDVKCEKVK